MKIVVELNEGYTIEDVCETGFTFSSRKDLEGLGMTLFLGTIHKSKLEALKAHPAVLSAESNEPEQMIDPDPKGPLQ